MSFTQKKMIHELGEYSTSQAPKHSSQRILGESKFYRMTWEETMQKGHDWLGGLGFLIRLTGPTF